MDAKSRQSLNGSTVSGSQATPTPWIIRVAFVETALLARIRLLPGLSVLVDNDNVWVRGDSLDEATDRQISSISGVEQFFIDSDGRLLRRGEMVPFGVCPEGEWQSLSDWIIPELPRTAFAGRIDTHVEWKLVRDDEPQDANSLVVSWPSWREYVEAAPLIRLRPLCYALSDRGMALVRGTPLPPLPGQYFCECHGIAVPAGWRLVPHVDAATIRKVWKLTDNDFVLCTLDGTFSIITEDQFVSASRSSVRLTDLSQFGSVST